MAKLQVAITKRLRVGIVGAFLVISALGFSSCGNSASSANSINTSSISYRDGYATATQNAANEGDPWFNLNGAVYGNQGACENNLLPYISQGDNKTEWMAGCIDGLAQAIYNAQHPGAGDS
jgi:hypothetical protein